MIFLRTKDEALLSVGGGGGLHLSLVQLFHQPGRQSKLSMAWERKNGREALMPPICPFAMINEVIRSVKSRFFLRTLECIGFK